MDVLRLTYAWDSLARHARLTLEQPEAGQACTVPVEDPFPLLLEDLRDLMLGRGGQACAPAVVFAALSDAPEPVGPMPTLSPDTPVATPQGYRAAGTLRRGDTVLTREGAVVPVLQRLERVVPTCGSFRPIRLRAPYFGLQQDIVVAPDQCLLIDGPEVEYLFGREAVLVPARHLLNGFNAVEEAGRATQRYCQLLLPNHETLILAGMPAESLYIGRLRRQRDTLAAGLLAQADRALLPEHGRRAHPQLQWYEAIHLARQRAA